jgi:1,4-dihydroxy-2-naphthoate octaprenyltransferase
MNEPKLTYRAFIEKANPLALLSCFVFYGLGAGTASFLGHLIDWSTYFIGQGFFIFLLLGCYFLNAYFSVVDLKLKDLAKVQANIKQPMLKLAIIALAMSVLLGFLLLLNSGVTAGALVLVLLPFLLAYLYSVPPVRWVYSGYGEFVHAVLLGGLAPAFAFFFQAKELHPILSVASLALTALWLAFELVLALKNYATDLKYENKTMMTRLGWESGVNFHNILALSAFVLMAVGAAAGHWWGVLWPGLLSIPIAGFQIWQLSQIINGQKPNWQLLVLTGFGLVNATAYLLAFSLWTR